jgi:hypothetical protein
LPYTLAGAAKSRPGSRRHRTSKREKEKEKEKKKKKKKPEVAGNAGTRNIDGTS